MRVYQEIIILSGMLIFVILAGIHCRVPEKGASRSHKAGSSESVYPEANEDSVSFIYRTGERKFSLHEIMSMDEIREEIITRDDSGNIEKSFSVRGVLLARMLDYLGEDINNLSAVRIEARDGYAVEIPRDILGKRKIILAYEMEGQPLFKGSKPIRVFVPQEEEMYWIKQAVRVHLIYSEENSGNNEISRIIFMETRFMDLDREDYGKDGLKAVKTTDLMPGVKENESISLLASDGLKKNENYDVFSRGLIVIEGEDAPSFRGHDIQKGMHVKNLLWAGTGETGFLSIIQAKNIFSENAVADQRGILLKDIADKFRLRTAEIYILESKDGTVTEISLKDMEKGIAFYAENANVSCVFEDVFEGKPIEDVVSISTGE